MYRSLELLVTASFLVGLTMLPASAQSADTTPPTLVALSFTPIAVDVSASPKNVVVTATITDDLSGVNNGTLYFYSPNGQYAATFLGRTSGTPLNGVYQGTMTIPRFSQGGVWKAQFNVNDLVGNQQTLNAGALQALGFPTDLTVTDTTPDTQPPTLLSASFSPATIDVSSADVSVTVSLQISDNASGTTFSDIVWFAVTLAPPTASSSTARQYLSSNDFHLASGTALNGTWQATKKMPRYSPAGPWQIQSVTLYDATRNTITLSAAQLQASGVNPVLTVNSTPSDGTPPALTNLTISPRVFNTSTGAQNVTLTMSASDGLSGVDFTPTTSNLAFILVGFRSPSGNQSVFVSPFVPPTNVGGTPLAGTWQMAATWPQFSEQGTWQVSFFTVKDAASNQVTYTPAMLRAMGLPDSVVVIKPSLTSDGKVGPAGGTITDSDFGSRASLTFPPGVVTNPNTSVSIDVFPSPLAVPTPRGFTSPGTYFVDLTFSPLLPSPIPAPGITVVLPLLTSMVPGAHLSLYHIDPVSGSVAPAMDAFHNFVVGTVNADGLSATFLNVVTLSAVVAYLSSGSVLGDVDGNGSITCADVSLVKASFGKRTGQPGFNSAADLNNDGVVDIRDLFVVTRQLSAGTVCQ